MNNWWEDCKEFDWEAYWKNLSWDKWVDSDTPSRHGFLSEGADRIQDITLPKRFKRIKHSVCRQDREWFEQHPGETEYAREYVPGECYPWKPTEWNPTHAEIRKITPDVLEIEDRIWVRQLDPGLRTRSFYIAVECLPGEYLVLLPKRKIRIQST